MSDLWLATHIFYRRVTGHGYTFQVNKHLHSEDYSIVDYYFRAKSSPFRRIRRQGLFSRGKFISIQKNFPPGIIFSGWIHPHSEESAGRDYFPEVNSSPFGRIRRQGLFSRGKFIPIQRNPSAGIIFPSRNHPHTKESTNRDYFPEPKASLFGRIRLQGCFGNHRRSPPNPRKQFQDAWRLETASG